MTKKKLPVKLPVLPPSDREIPLSETLIPKLKEGTWEECKADIRRIAEENPERVITRNFYRINGRYAESVWSQYVGTFHEFKRQAGIILSRQQHQHEKNIAKHASVDHYRRLSAERLEWGEKYLRDGGGRFKTGLICADLHDKEIDPFFNRCLQDTALRVQPDFISIIGDLFDLPEFGKYTVDPREWDVVGRIQFARENILKPLRESCPDAQIDVVEGNHEARLLRTLADATPALRAVLSDLHGMTVADLFRLPEYQINYVALGDLATYTQRDFDSELRKNYRVYHKSFVAHHFPDARSMGMPGANGHHHRHIVWSMFSPVFGAYEWHQLGAGHRRDASYCNGEKWHNGFALVHIDTQTRATIIEYIPITDFAVIGGKFYTRTAEEFVAAHPAAAL